MEITVKSSLAFMGIAAYAETVRSHLGEDGEKVFFKYLDVILAEAWKQERTPLRVASTILGGI